MKKYKKRNFIIILILSFLIKLKILKGKKKVNIFGFKLILDLDLPGISKAIFCEHYREIDHTNLFSEKLKNKNRILDLGANIGYYALLEASDSSNTSKILCIEPDQRNLSLLKENIKINKLQDRIEILSCAVSGEDGTVHINTKGASNLTKIENNFINLNDLEIVKSITLNTIYKKYGIFDCLRMDVEGAESVIFSNNSDLFLKNMPKNSLIFIEVHPGKYINGDAAISGALENIKNNGFYRFSFVTSGKFPSIEILKKLGKSNIIFKDGKFTRHYYSEVKFEDLKFFTLYRPKVLRYIILEK